MPLKNFYDLEAWKRGHALVLSVYMLTKKYPSEEKFGLSNQSRRAAVSVTSNISEGFGRNSQNDKKHFYSMAKTSLAELQNQMIIARDLHYITPAEFQKILQQGIHVDKLIAGLIKSAPSKNTHT